MDAGVQPMLNNAALTSTRTVERALALLAEVCAAGPVALSECARRARVPTSTALRLLRTMEALDFLSRDADGRFGTGPRVLQIGAQAFGSHGLVMTTRPSLERVVKVTGESTYLSVRGPAGSALNIDAVEGTHSIRHTTWAGRTVPMAGTAVGAALSGDVGPAGYVALRSAEEPDVTSIAAPIRRPGGIAGAITVVGPAYRIDDSRLRSYGEVVSQEAAAVSAQFGLNSSTSRK
jgi:urocanate hydratase